MQPYNYQIDQHTIQQAALLPERMKNKMPDGGKKFKKDAMWKPLIRMFRRFLKKSALSKHVLKIVKQTKLSLRAAVIENALGLPEELTAMEHT